MNKKKLTLLIALSILILYLVLSCYTITVAVAPAAADTCEPTVEIELVTEETTEEAIITPEKEKPKLAHVPKVRDFKSYTDYRKLNKKSAQWKKIQTIAYTDENGLRKVDDYYCVAMGSYYTKTLGDLFKITTENGNTFNVIITDFKSDRHTNSTHQYTARNNCIVEFYVNVDKLNTATRRSGSISTISEFNGRIVSIEKLGNYFID